MRPAYRYVRLRPAEVTGGKPAALLIAHSVAILLAPYDDFRGRGSEGIWGVIPIGNQRGDLHGIKRASCHNSITCGRCVRGWEMPTCSVAPASCGSGTERHSTRRFFTKVNSRTSASFGIAVL